MLLKEGVAKMLGKLSEEWRIRFARGRGQVNLRRGLRASALKDGWTWEKKTIRKVDQWFYKVEGSRVNCRSISGQKIKMSVFATMRKEKQL